MVVKNNSYNMRVILSDFFKVLGDPTRIEIIFALKNGQMNVNDLALTLGMTQSAVSHQLKTLRDANIVKFQRSGKEIFYMLADNHVHVIMQQVIEHIVEEK